MFITDLDNTLYNFIDFYAPCFRGMIHALSKPLKIEEEELIKQFKDVFQKHNSIEYGFAVQELECMKNKTTDEISEYIKLAKGAFSRVRQKNLITYPNVKDTLIWLKKQDVIVVGATNAPKFHALRRLRQLRIEKYFDALVCWEGAELTYDEHSKRIIDKDDNGEYKSKIDIQNIIVLPKEKLKPNIDGYKILLDKFNILPKNCYILGDSISKDVNPANQLNANGIWAKYGVNTIEKNMKTILSISNWDKKKLENIYFVEFEEPKLILNDFSELKNIFSINQLELDFH